MRLLEAYSCLDASTYATLSFKIIGLHKLQNHAHRFRLDLYLKTYVCSYVE